MIALMALAVFPPFHEALLEEQVPHAIEDLDPGNTIKRWTMGSRRFELLTSAV